MKTKICEKCKLEKNITEFCKIRLRDLIIRGKCCKECFNGVLFKKNKRKKLYQERFKNRDRFNEKSYTERCSVNRKISSIRDEYM